MEAKIIRKKFLEYFENQGHKIVPSAPMVIKNDPTLMFTNAGMNQFKENFLGHAQASDKRVADTQKCLRVSGKHNDLEEVGHDNYHHTMFEMLGNWSFNDYFKEKAIDFAWEFLTDIMKISKDRFYVTVFEGDQKDGLAKDDEAHSIWKKYLSEQRIINGSKKDNFWEMGDTGPCGPCSEIHIDLRPDNERQKESGVNLVNQNHPLVIELWNLVFIQFNRKASGELELLPQKHIDTGMGFERLCMVMQNKSSAYETDVFMPIIDEIEKITNTSYGKEPKIDVAYRVVADHLRAVSFAIADGEVPSNTGAGYVIRRILRRAVRYAYTFLNVKEPVIHKLVVTLVKSMGQAFPELRDQQELITKVIKEEEVSFLNTLDTGIKLLDELINKAKQNNNSTISGEHAFKLYDTFGFPLDLTKLILKENNLSVDEQGFNEEMKKQKDRSRQATSVDTGDWIEIDGSEKTDDDFVGYDYLMTEIKIIKYRKIKAKGKELYQLVFDKTPFYPESGGQVGDTGYIETGSNKIQIVDTQKENNLIIHLAKQLPDDPQAVFKAFVYESKRTYTANNHTATHLLHDALREVLGEHVEQKGSLVHPDYLRFDFSHFQSVTQDELRKIENKVNEKIRMNFPLEEKRSIPMQEAMDMGATGLFGEKYGEFVRVVKFGDIIELCGGTHVKATGQIGFFKILSESAVAAGIRRIEAVTAVKSQEFIQKQEDTIKEINELLKTPKNISTGIQSLIQENSKQKKQLESLSNEKANFVKQQLLKKQENINGLNLIVDKIEIDSASSIKNLAFQLKNEVDNLVLILGAVANNKPNLTIMISENLVKEKNLNANQIIREAAAMIKGGGGGQPFYATAGGKDVTGIEQALSKAKEMVVG